MDIKNRIRPLLLEFVSHEAVADMYASLLEFGPQTISQLARSTGVERTRIYRTLHELQSLYLIEIELQPHRQIVRPAPIANLYTVIANKQASLRALTENVRKFGKDFESSRTLNDKTTRVQFYKGKEGIEQMLWNQTKARGSILSILSENLQSHTGQAFFDRWVERCNQNHIVCRSLVDQNFLSAQKQWYGDETKHSLEHWVGRKLSEDLTDIPHRTTVYDDITTYFNWQDGDAHGIEIHSQNIADTQRQYFELLWQKSTPL